MIPCPKGCPKPLIDSADLYRHLRDYHRTPDFEARHLSGVSSAPGWYEQKTNTPDGEKALEHQIASAKASITSTAPLKIPMVSIDKKPEVTIGQGWQKTDNGYRFEKTVREDHTLDNYIRRVVKGELRGEHGTLVLWTYDKDISELSAKQEKAGILEAKLTSYVPSDAEWVTVSTELHQLLYDIKMMKQELQPDVYNEVKLEESYHDTGFEEGRFEKWQSEFMQKSNTETARIETELNKNDPTKL